MPILEVDSKAFKATITQSRKLAEQSGARRQTIMLKGDSPELIAINDHTQFHTFLKGTVQAPGAPLYINPDTLTSYKPRAKVIKLEWQDNAQLQIQDGATKYNLKLGVAAIKPADPSLGLDPSVIPGKVLTSIRDAVSLPHALHKADPTKMPVHFSSKNGKLTVMATDGYTIVQCDTDIKYESETVKIPLYLLDLYVGEDGDVQFAPDEFQLQTISQNRRLITSTLDENDLNLDAVFGSIKDPLLSFDFDPKILQDEISPITDMLDAKEKLGAIIVMQASSNHFSLHLSHRELGKVDAEKLESISNPYFERGLSSITVNMHPKAFLEYTKLVAGLKVKTARATCAANLVYYDAKTDWGRVRYIFPTVAI